MSGKATSTAAEHWTEIISPKTNMFHLPLKEVWRYRDLLFLLVRREYVASYKQTILGPIWVLLQPLLTSLMFIIVFSRIAGIGTDGVPEWLFYLAGLTLWNYFAECLNKTATVFKDNATIFGKVYFPRLIMPLSIIVANFIRFGIQFLLFLVIWLYYLFFTDSAIQPNWVILLLPFFICLMGALSLGMGLIISSLTTKYRDLIFLLTFGVQLLMYATPVIYPLSGMGEKYKIFILANPMTSVIEAFRYSFLGSGVLSWAGLVYSFVCSIVVLAVGAIVFNKVEKGFMDTV